MKLLLASILLFVAVPNSALLAQESDSLDMMIGQMIMVGLNNFDDPDNREPVLKHLREGKLGGILLFEKDLSQDNTKANLAQLVNSLQQASAIPLFMAIDEEGGKVNRLKPKYGFPSTLSASYLGQLNDLDSTYYYGASTAQNLSNFGFNVNFAPTVDVNINAENPVIGKMERSYSPNHTVVLQHAARVIASHDEFSVATALKHFPGHGSSAADTHLGVADVSDSWLIEELFPYKALVDSGMVRAVMSAHVVNRVLDGEMLPASLSKPMIDGVLRKLIGFDGVVFSDDMHMGAISKHYGLEEAVVLAVNAGLDVLVFSNNVFDDERTSGIQVHQLIKDKVLAGEIPIARIMESYIRITKLKESLGLMEADFKQSLSERLKKHF